MPGKVLPVRSAGFFQALAIFLLRPDLIKAQLTAAGFDAVSCDRVELTSVAATARDVAAAFCQGTPLRGEIEQRAPERMSEIVDQVAERVQSRYGARPSGRMSALIAAGRAS